MHPNHKYISAVNQVEVHITIEISLIHAINSTVTMFTTSSGKIVMVRHWSVSLTQFTQNLAG